MSLFPTIAHWGAPSLIWLGTSSFQPPLPVQLASTTYIIDAFHLSHSIHRPGVIPLSQSRPAEKNPSASLAHGSPENREALPRLGLKVYTPRSAFRDRAEAKRTHTSCVRLQSNVDVPSLIRRVPWGVSVETRRLQSDKLLLAHTSPFRYAVEQADAGRACRVATSTGCVAQGRSSMCLILMSTGLVLGVQSANTRDATKSPSTPPKENVTTTEAYQHDSGLGAIPRYHSDRPRIGAAATKHRTDRSDDNN